MYNPILNFFTKRKHSFGYILRYFCLYQVNEAGMTLGKYCGEQDRFSLMTLQNTVLVRFFSDGMNTSQGFTLLWEAMGTSH